MNCNNCGAQYIETLTANYGECMKCVAAEKAKVKKEFKEEKEFEKRKYRLFAFKRSQGAKIGRHAISKVKDFKVIEKLGAIGYVELLNDVCGQAFAIVPRHEFERKVTRGKL